MPNSGRDRERVEAATFERLKAELTTAFAAPETRYTALNADAVFARNAAPHERMHQIERFRDDAPG